MKSDQTLKAQRKVPTGHQGKNSGRSTAEMGDQSKSLGGVA